MNAISFQGAAAPVAGSVMGLFSFAWLPRVLFVITMGLALLLGTTVLVAPLAAQLSFARDVRVIQLFARDAVLRRTSLVSAGGLAITSWVFFRPPRVPRKAPATVTHESPAGMTGA